MKMQALAHKKILLVGYGIEGKATEAFLQKMVQSVQIGIADATQGEDYLAHQGDYDLAIKSPHVNPALLTIPYTTATNIFFATVKGMTIGVSGTKGKTTTASLLYEILKQAGKKVHLVGNIGNPMLSELLLSNTEEDIWVCELSSYQLADIAYSPHIAVFVSLFPEHMDFHGSTEKYYTAKARLIAKSESKDYVVYNPKFPQLEAIVKASRAQAIPSIATLPFSEENILLEGEHNRDNIKAAVTVARLLGIADRDSEKAVQKFKAVRHRLQKVGTFREITFYDDAISTTPESTLAALHTLSQVGTLFLGGEDRGYNFTPLIEKLITLRIPNLVFFPESGKTMKQLLQKQQGYKPLVLETSSMEEAVKFAYLHTPKKTICLLSTASPSYTVWKNFEEKGDEFQRLVKELGKSV